jgi:hypothetical protein
MKESGSVVLETALIWLNLVRDTNFDRTVASRVIDNGQRISCMWTSTRVAGWRDARRRSLSTVVGVACDDLWNLLKVGG